MTMSLLLRSLIIFTATAVFANGAEPPTPAAGSAASTQPTTKTTMQIESQAFGTTPAGDEVTKFTLTNTKGHSISVMNWGATLMEVNVPDRDGKLANVNLCFDSLKPYLSGHPYFGSSVGRFCNRIEHGKFAIDGVDYQVTLNAGKHHLHGGKKGFTYKTWDSATYQTDDAVGVKFNLTSPDGEEGYPGTVDATVDYQWNDDNELTIDFAATTDAATHINMTNHSYWNLGGAGSGSAMDHVAVIEADEILDVDEDLIPTGTINSVDGTVFDFRTSRSFGERVDTLAATKGYDHCYVVRGTTGQMRRAATVSDPKTGRVLEIETTQPGMQLYTANHLPGTDKSAGAGMHEAFCLETQHYPNTPNRPAFPTTLLKPGSKMRETTVHRFSVE
ncbi:aldose epimerase family protein [Rubripirellula reticaptiva]|uniref:Aldose 1-epimerase n=2 Tax=Rubripirellula reticaptiva TaxID=2528013 RepID=A0A5C6EIC6_9BACT|nr:aldose epimerase family protein [Rubripirellula reticaptiva]TWU48254.1 Aldose 1-epimerase precursor [Rubripirellula reticaptiva]